MATRYSPYYSTGMMVNHMPEPWFNQFDTPLAPFRTAMTPTPLIFKSRPGTNLYQEREIMDIFGTLPRFLRNLWTMLNDTSVDDAIEWADTNSFLLKNTEKFAQEVIPKYFKHNKLSSFVRQLNTYQFVKVRKTQNKASYRWTHKHLVRGNIRALLKIRRKVTAYEKKGQIVLNDLMAKMAEQQRTIEELQFRMKLLEGEVVKGRDLHLTVKLQLQDAKGMLETIFSRRPNGDNRSKSQSTLLPQNTSYDQVFQADDWLPKKHRLNECFSQSQIGLQVQQEK